MTGVASLERRFRVLSSGDPTATLTLRRQFSAEMYKRLRSLKGVIFESVARRDALLLGEGEESRNIPLTLLQRPPEAGPLNPMQPPYHYPRSRDKVEGFMGWLREQERKGILQVAELPGVGGATFGGGPAPWTNVYIRRAYVRGIEKALGSLKRSFTAAEVDALAFRSLGGAGFLVNQPFHAERAALLYTRAFDLLKGVTEQMDKEMSQILTRGIAEGAGPYDLARKMNKRVDVGISRAQRIARTEVVYAHNNANLNEYERIQDVVGGEVLVEWETAEDERVRSTHAARHGKVYTKKEVRPLLGEPNCRCAILPVIRDDEGEEQE